MPSTLIRMGWSLHVNLSWDLNCLSQIPRAEYIGGWKRNQETIGCCNVKEEVARLEDIERKQELVEVVTFSFEASMSKM